MVMSRPLCHVPYPWSAYIAGAAVLVGVALFLQPKPIGGPWPDPYAPSIMTPPPVQHATSANDPLADDRFAEQRAIMVDRDLRGRDITDPAVLWAMSTVPRHEFVLPALIDEAYVDAPLPIGREQTISQPYIVALMTQLARPSPKSKALDVGTGSGYQAAVLAEICDQVYSIEIVEPLADAAERRLKRLGYDKVVTRRGDGYRGWPEEAPFDVIILAAAPDHVPAPLIDQLAPGGRMVLPVGASLSQELIVIAKDERGNVRQERVAAVAFVPMTGEAQDR